ncbi:MAG TPA: hypothetical protein VIQ31_15110, partial [Phormidium sp.]
EKPRTNFFVLIIVTNTISICKFFIKIADICRNNSLITPLSSRVQGDLGINIMVKKIKLDNLTISGINHKHSSVPGFLGKYLVAALEQS